MSESFFEEVHALYKDVNPPTHLKPLVYLLALRNTALVRLRRNTQRETVRIIEEKPLQERQLAFLDTDLDDISPVPRTVEVNKTVPPIAPLYTHND